MSGPYAAEGENQRCAALIAVEEINAMGGILGRRIELVERDSRSRAGVSVSNVTEMIDHEGVRMVFGGVSSGVAVAAGHVCQRKGVLFFPSLTASRDTTGIQGHRHTFREFIDTWMISQALAYHLKEHFPDETYAFVTADYTFGHTLESDMRTCTGLQDKEKHPSRLIPFPDATIEDFRTALREVTVVEPGVLLLNLFGKQVSQAIAVTRELGLHKDIQIVVPLISLTVARDVGAEDMAGVMGASPWCWKVPYVFDFWRGQVFVEEFARRYKRYPCSASAAAYTILYEYKAAVERAETFDAPAVIHAIEDYRYAFKVIGAMQGHEYQMLKDAQVWRRFDHQSLQTVYVLQCKPAEEVRKDKFASDFFEVVGSLGPEKSAISYEVWRKQREAAGKPLTLEPLPGDKPFMAPYGQE